MIIEAKKGLSNTSNPPRHVLCAESDPERDSWVDVLVRSVNGGHFDDKQNPSSSSSSTYSNGLSPIITSVALDSGQPRSSTSSVGYPDQTLVPKHRGYSRDDAGRPTHGTLRKDGDSPVEPPTSTSLPSSSPLDGDSHTFPVPRSQSSLGHDESSSDIRGTPSRLPPSNPLISPPGHHRTNDRDKRRSVQPIKSTTMPKPSLDGRSTSPDIHTPKVDQNGRVKISGPIGGAPIPTGYIFGTGAKEREKDILEQSTPGSDRKERAKSRTFWGAFGRPTGMFALLPVLQHARLMVF